MIKAYAHTGKVHDAYYWRPEDDYSWFDNLEDQWAENVFGQVGKWLGRKVARDTGTGTPFDALRDRSVLDEAVGELDHNELYLVMERDITDLDEAVLSVVQEREAGKRRQRLRDADPVQSFFAGVVAELPKALAELAVFRSSGPLLRYMRAPRTVQSFAARDVMSVAAVEYTAAGIVAGVNPYDTVEDAIVNGTLGTLMGATMIAGIEGTRAAWGKYRSAQRVADLPPDPPSGPC